jgi:large subunit ribosomal protein L22
MEYKAIGRFLRISPRKARLVANKLKGKGIQDATALLDYSPKRAAGLVKKILKSAVANAENNFKVADVNTLFVKIVSVDEGPTLKRNRPMSMGRAGRIRKRTSHITVVLTQRD